LSGFLSNDDSLTLEKKKKALIVLCIFGTGQVTKKLPSALILARINDLYMTSVLYGALAICDRRHALSLNSQSV
jgi:hypothetical protein